MAGPGFKNQYAKSKLVKISSHLLMMGSIDQTLTYILELDLRLLESVEHRHDRAHQGPKVNYHYQIAFVLHFQYTISNSVLIS